ncbi:hypothetical protein Zm00014a_020084 [Zea mays]
MRDCQ